jgi:hypothetical protein
MTRFPTQSIVPEVYESVAYNLKKMSYIFSAKLETPVGSITKSSIVTRMLSKGQSSVQSP